MLNQPLNLIVFISYFIIITLIGIFAGRKERNTNDYFLGEKKIPWFAVCLSILATECSSVTFIGVPSIAYAKGGNFTYIQLAIGSLIGRILIATILLIPFYKFEVTSIYEYLKERFGIKSQTLGAIFFFVTRLLATGVRLYSVSLAMHVVFGIPILFTIALVSGFTTLYTIVGGIKAVIWTDVVQFVIFMAGAIISLGYIYVYCDGFHNIFTIANAANKWQFFDTTFSWTNEFTLINGIMFGCFMTFAALGTDQDLTQRMLTCKHSKLAQKALVVTGILDFPLVIIFLAIGVFIYVFFQLHPDPNIPAQTDKIFPYFILKYLPDGVAGLLVVSIFSAEMSSLSSALNALSSSAICDIYRPTLAKGKSEKHYLLVSRISVVMFAVISILIAYMCKNIAKVLVLAFKIGSYTYGGLLGVFLLGTLTKKGSDRGNIIAMVSSVVVVFLASKTKIAWSWFVIIGTVWTLVLGILYPYIENFIKKLLKPDNKNSINTANS